MKKTFKIAAFVAAAMMGFGFVSCANDDAEDLGTLLIVKDYQEKKEAEAAAAAAAAKAASSVATLSYDGSAEANVPSVTGAGDVFGTVSTDISFTLSSDFTVDTTNSYPKWESSTFTGDDGTKNGTTVAGQTVASTELKAGKIALPKEYVACSATYTFTLAKAAKVTAAVGAANTQSGNLAGKLEILDSSSAVKTTKTAAAGSKSDNSVTADAVSLDAGTYTIKFSWVTLDAVEQSKGLKKVKCIISSLNLKAEPTE